MRRGTLLKIAVLSLLVLLLHGTGCGRLQSAGQIKNDIRQVLPEAKVLDVESGTRPGSSYKFKRYTVENKGIVFTYENRQGLDTLFGTTAAFYENDYCETLFAFFQKDIAGIIEKYQVELEVRSSYVWLHNDIARMQDIDRGVDAVQEIYALMEDYIPAAESSWFDFSIYLDTENFGRAEFILIEKQGDWDAEYYRQLLYLNLKDAVEQGLASKVETSPELLDAIPQKYIRNLYINGEAYQSDKYEICFLYNIRDGRYYTPVGFGIELEYNGGVEDHLQREIIERYYPEAGYTISMKDQTSSYRIGEDQYVVERREDSLVFLKNGEELPIVYEREISDTHPGAVYFYWVSVEDFASLIGATVERVEDSGVYLLLP